MSVLSEIFKHKIVAIVRGAKPGDVEKIAGALYESGIKLMEVTLNSENALEVIERLSNEMKGKMYIGAGTVLSVEDTEKAIKAGAQFIISPCLNTDVIAATKRMGAVSIPGAFTPTEIVNAFNSGGEIIKVFPASGSISYIKEVRAPLSHIPLMPTGGISLENIKEFQKAGAVAFGIGTSLVNTKKEITEEYLVQLITTAKQFVQAIAT
jgi:2-dehydro-3-deoxyphosphogluconate aldolase / (4S)-4-hydroxy-2-oxoglutarate aldolase